MKYLRVVLKGFFIGIAKIIPGVSGAMVAMSLGVYEVAVDAISHFFTDLKKNMLLLGLLGIGIILAIVLMSNVVSFFITNFYFPTTLLFIGLILGGLPMIFKKMSSSLFHNKNLLVFFLTIFLVLFLGLFSGSMEKVTFSPNLSTSFYLFMVGLIDAVTMVIPGISGTAIFMLMGCYDAILNLYGSIHGFSQIVSQLYAIIPLGIGLILGIVAVSKLMNYLFNHHQTTTYAAIFGFSLSSIFLLLITTFSSHYLWTELIIGIILLIFGYFLARRLE